MSNNEDKLNTKDKIELVIEAGLQLIPVVGGALSTSYFGYKNEKRFKRLESFYKEFSNSTQVNPVKFEQHDQDVLIALIEQLNDKVEKEALEEKRSFFKSFLKSSLETPSTKRNFDERRFFLDKLDEMTLLEIELLLFVSKERQSVVVGGINKPGVDQFAIVGSVGRIKNYGFITASQNSFSIGAGANALNEAIQVNEFGKRFIEFCLTE